MTQTPPDEPTNQRFASLAANAFEAIYHRLAPHRAAARDDAISAWLEGHEADAAQLSRQVLADVASHPDFPEVARPIFDMLMRPEHQTQAILTVLGVYPIVSAFVGAAVQPFVQDIANLAWSHHTSMPLSPPEAALAVLRGNWTRDQGVNEAAQFGIDSARFDILELNTGEPPGLQQLQEALRRGIIDPDRFAKGVRQSRVRNEWLDVELALRYQPVGPGEVLAGLVQGHLTLADATHRIDIAGIDPSNIGWLYETHGRPPGIVELGQLVNRGEMSEADWEQAVRESDIKNKYIPALRLLHRHLMPERTVVSAVRQGVLTPEVAKGKLGQLGFDAADAATLVAEASTTKHAHVRDLTEQQTLGLYTERLISRPAAVTMLAGLGFDASEVEMVLQLADNAHRARYEAAAVSKVHSLYIARHIDYPTASADLDKIGIASDDRDGMLKLWKLERDSVVRTLTLAEMQGLAHRDVWKFPVFHEQVMALGYSKGHARLLYFLAFPPSDQPKNVPEV